MISISRRRANPIHQASCYGAASLILLLASIAFGSMLTQSMALHMLVHIPLIIIAGTLAAMALRALYFANNGAVLRRPCRLAKYNELGLSGLALCTFVWAYWMIPKSLDEVLVSLPADVLKYAGLFLAGMVLCDSLARSNSVIKLFFLGNFSWMTAIVGLLYQDEPERLCNFYLLGDQELAGRGLLILAVAVPVAWVVAERRRILHYLR